MIEVMLKSLFKKIFNIFNYEIVKKKYSGIIDKREWIPFQYSNDDYKLYFEGLEASKNKQTDNFHKQSRFLDLIGLVKIVLRQNKVEDFVEAGCWKGHSSYLISKLISKLTLEGDMFINLSPFLTKTFLFILITFIGDELTSMPALEISLIQSFADPSRIGIS